jgi:hypothetical protein
MTTATIDLFGPVAIDTNIRLLLATWSAIWQIRGMHVR